MGSSTKKHKSDKKKKRSRSKSVEKVKEKHHRHHKRHHKDRKRKADVDEVEIISSDSDVEEVLVPPPPKISRASTPPAPKITKEVSPPSPPRIDPSDVSVGDGKSHDSLSVEETNKLRAKLGLKPLQVQAVVKQVQVVTGDKKDGVLIQGEDGEFVHKPATNLSDRTRGEKVKSRLTERKEKRAIEARLKSVKGLGEASDGEDDAKKWVLKSRNKELERKEADKRAKLLEELDEEFGIGDLIEEDKRHDVRKAYTARDLRGLRVGHAVDGFDEGRSLILTLKDKGVLEEEEDTLVNVNMLDNERYKKNIEKKKKPAKLYEDNEDDYLEGKERDILSKYNEEIDGEKTASFSLGQESNEMERVRMKLAARSKLMEAKNLVSLNTGLQLASEYYTQEEIQAKFKKPKKVRKIRRKILKADDLVPKEDIAGPSEDLGSRKSRSQTKRPKNEVPMDIVKAEPLEDILDVDDLPPLLEDLSDVKLEPDEGELELQQALSKARKLKLKESAESSVEKMAKAIVEQSHGQDAEDGAAGSIILNSTAEFCRTLGDIPTYGLSGNREEEEAELLDFEMEMKEEKKRHKEDKKTKGAWNQVEIEDRPVELLPSEVPILDAEPDVGSGVAGALRLALSKGYLEKETDNRPSASRFAHLQAQNYSIDDKAHVDDEKFGRRERYVGPTTDFKEKDNYKPNVKLDYIDDDGHLLNAKEAFRYLSHKFHGKGPGKNKVEKRMKKNEQEGLMKQMSSTDTPLRTLTMLQKKQVETQSPFVVLSGNKTNSISKGK